MIGKSEGLTNQDLDTRFWKWCGTLQSYRQKWSFSIRQTWENNAEMGSTCLLERWTQRTERCLPDECSTFLRAALRHLL